MSNMFARTSKLSAAFGWFVSLMFGQAPTSPVDLIGKVTSALEGRDQEALATLTITKAEFKEYVWPTLVLTRLTGDEKDLDRFYSQYRTESDAAMASLLQHYAGQKLRVVRIAILTDRVVPSKKKKEKPTPQRYELLGGPNVTVRHEDGHEEVIRLVGGLLQHDGIWHVTTYEMAPN